MPHCKERDTCKKRVKVNQWVTEKMNPVTAQNGKDELFRKSAQLEIRIANFDVLACKAFPPIPLIRH
jgi:hypothetical protein